MPLLNLNLRKRCSAWFLAHSMERYERELAPRKQKLFADLSGEDVILEIGAGAGVNFRYYPRGCRILAVEPNRYLHRWLRRRAGEHALQLEIVCGAAESLALASGSADVAVSTLVLCSVADQQPALAEIRRVLRPGGRFLFLEHVGAPPGTRLRRWQGRLRPLWSAAFDGCRPDRDTARAIQAAGFRSVDIEAFASPVPFIRPHIAGVATLAGSPRG
jgi:SAM-dependent methyltransferase